MYVQEAAAQKSVYCDKFFRSIFLIIFYILVQGCMSIKHLWAELTKSLIKAQRKFQVIPLFIALEDSHTVTKLEMKRVTEDAKN